jgi:signal transduction histidine kinase
LVRYGPADAALAEEIVRRAGIAIENARLFRLAQEASRAKSDFLAIVSHELRTPLAAVVGYTGLLEEGIGGGLTPSQTEFTTAIRRSAEHLTRLIDQVITFARLEGDHDRLHEEEVGLEALLGDVVTLTGPLAMRKGLALELEAPDEPVELITDGRKLSQILINLVSNAIKYTDRGRIILQVEAPQDEVVVRVRDTGRGIPAGKLDEIFEPFRQLDEPGTRREGGAGIGLSIVKNLTRLLGGEVGVESVVGEGTTFSVRLPRRHLAGAPGSPLP